MVCYDFHSKSWGFSAFIWLMWWDRMSSGNASIIQGFSNACAGLILFSGSHYRHDLIKARNSLSSDPTASYKLFEPGFLFPLKWSSSKNFLFLGAWSNRVFGGNPNSSEKRSICSISLEPGNRAWPLESSARMHPKDHISIAGVYATPKMISGAL